MNCSKSSWNIIIRFIDDFNPHTLFNSEDETYWETIKKAVKKLYLRIHPDKNTTNKEYFGRIFKEFNNAFIEIQHIYENEFDKCKENAQLLNSLNTLFLLKNLYKDLDQLDESFNTILVHDDRNLKVLLNKAITEKQKRLSESKEALLRTSSQIVDKVFISSASECNDETCSMDNCKNKTSSIFTIIPCCYKASVHRDCISSYFYNSFTNNDSEKTLLDTYKTKVIQLSENLQCPFCTTKWFNDSFPTQRNYSIKVFVNNDRLSDEVFSKIHGLYYNNVFFSMKNELKNSVTKLEDENIKLSDSNNCLKRKVIKLKDDIEGFKRSKYQFNEVNEKDETMSDNFDDTSSIGNNLDRTDNENYENSVDDNNQDYLSPIHDNNNSNYTYDTDEYQANNNSHDKNNCSPQVKFQSRSETIYMASSIIHTIREVNQIAKNVFMNKKLFPTLDKNDSNQIILRCPFYPRCNRHYITQGGEAIAGKTLQSFRVHACSGLLGNEKIRLVCNKNMKNLKWIAEMDTLQ
jgi:hypothetical protein